MDEIEIVWPKVRSPCVGVCRCNERDVCIGCGRTRQEIARWMEMTDEEKEWCKAQCPERLVKLRNAD